MSETTTQSSAQVAETSVGLSRLAGARDTARPLVHLVACGSVDDGKSTLIGRLLAETGSVPDDQLEHARRVRRGGSAIPVGEIDYSLVTDGLEAEREQGITIDVAYRQLQLPSGRRVVIADAPGHEQYTRNMAVAASNADLALLVVDAERGLRPQTHRHLTVCALMGVGSVIVAVNKMDAVGHAREVFEQLAGQLEADARRMGVSDVLCVPVSALLGDNVTTRSSSMTYYDGPTVLEGLAGWDPPCPEQRPLRMAVQYVTRSAGFRGYAGTVVAGSVGPGDEVVVTTTGVSAKVERVTTFDGDLDRAETGAAVTLVLDRDVDLSRGDLLAGAADPPEGSTAFAAELVWVGEQPLMHGRSYLLVSGPRVVPATVTTLRARLEVTSGQEVAARRLETNDIGRVEIATDAPIALDPYGLCRDTGGFLLVDRVSCDTVAAGLVRHVLRRSGNVVPHAYVVDRQARARIKNQQPRVLWLTGLPGAGKSTLADALERRLHAMGIHTYVLDGDNLRKGMNRDLGFTPEDRAENVRRVAETARLLFDAGLVVVVALVSPFRADRRRAREMFEPGDFVEAFLDTPFEVCARRDPKGLYSQADCGSLPNMTGVGQEYEIPEHADVVVDGALPLAQAVEVLAGALVPEHHEP
ncbi:MAG TPA: adenylyl-sulfate kinase [Acidimicrobiales bacterium]|nr:adenylyl-sulfate kinase [Acidimicrobiales bacterium]